MASSSSIVNPLVGVAISEKLSKTNHSVWKAQILAAVRGSRLQDHLQAGSAPSVTVEGKVGDKPAQVPNPAYEEWYVKDQQVLSFILGSLGRDVQSQVVMKQTAAAAWSTIEAMFSSQTRARAVNTRIALATTQKGNLSVAEYVGKMRSLGDDMAAAGRPLKMMSWWSTSSPALIMSSTPSFLPSSPEQIQSR